MIPNKLSPFGYENPPAELKNPVDAYDLARMEGQGSKIVAITEDGWYRCVSAGAKGADGKNSGGNGGRINVRLYLRKEWGAYLSASSGKTNGAGAALKEKYGTGNGGSTSDGKNDNTGMTSGHLGGGGYSGWYSRSGGGGGGALGNGGGGAYKGGAGGGGAAIIIYDRTNDFYGWNTAEPYYYTKLRNPNVGDQIYDGNRNPIAGMVVGATTTSGNYIGSIQISKDGVLQSAIAVNDNAPDVYQGWLMQEDWKYLVLASGGGGGCGDDGSNRRGGAGGGAGTKGGNNTYSSSYVGGSGGYTGVKSADKSETAKDGTNTGGAYAAGVAGVGNVFDVRVPEKPVLVKDIIDRDARTSTTGLAVIIRQVEA